MRLSKHITFILVSIASVCVYAQNDPANPAPIDERIKNNTIKSVWVEQETAKIYPNPVSVVYGSKQILLAKDGKAAVSAKADSEDEIKALNLFNRLISKFGYPEVPISNKGFQIEFRVDPEDFVVVDGQAYKIECEDNTILLTGISPRALLYASASLSQLVFRDENNILIRLAEVFDFPSYQRRMFNCSPVSSQLEDDLDWMAKYKMESITFHNRNFGWFGMDDELKNNLEIYKNWSDKYGGVEAVLLMNLYRDDTDIEITNPEHIALLQSTIEFAAEQGVSRILLFADDSPPFKYDEGYYLDSENDKKKFSSMAEAHCALMNTLLQWSREEQHNIEYYYCPSFYTAEEMHYGDMKLFRDTPWEEDAFKPLERDLGIIGEKLDPEIQIFWTGPYVCTRKITNEDIDGWKNYLNGRTPFLFDNSIFSHLEFTARTFFTAYDNDFPKDFQNITAGNGIFINGDATGETSKASSMTANAFMWEGDRYNGRVSIMEAMNKLYGAEKIPALMRYREIELELCKVIRQRQIWFAADELWKAIRKTRFTTQKNPFYYHRNYGRLKALRMQVKYSVPEPESKTTYKEKCVELDNDRRNLLAEIESMGLQKLSYYLQSEMISLPDFGSEE